MCACIYICMYVCVCVCVCMCVHVCAFYLFTYLFICLCLKVTPCLGRDVLSSVTDLCYVWQLRIPQHTCFIIQEFTVHVVFHIHTIKTSISLSRLTKTIISYIYELPFYTLFQKLWYMENSLKAQ